MRTASLTAAVSSQSKPARVPSAVHRSEQYLARAALLGFTRPLHDAAAGGLAASLHIYLRVANGICGLGIAAGIDGDDHGLGAEVAADGLDQRGIGERGGVDADLVGAGIEDLLSIVRAADAAADGEGDEEFAGSAAHGVEQGLAAFVGRGDVEQDDFVGAFASVARGLRCGIAGVDKIDELHAFDDAAVVHVEAGDDALGQHSVSLPCEKIARGS